MEDEALANRMDLEFLKIQKMQDITVLLGAIFKGLVLLKRNKISLVQISMHSKIINTGCLIY